MREVVWKLKLLILIETKGVSSSWRGTQLQKPFPLIFFPFIPVQKEDLDLICLKQATLGKQRVHWP